MANYSVQSYNKHHGREVTVTKVLDEDNVLTSRKPCIIIPSVD